MLSSPDWCDQKVFQRNRLPPRSYYVPETSICLNGKWDFNYSSSPQLAPDGKIVSTLSSAELQKERGEWTSIDVPGHWQLQGYGRPQYTNIVYPFPVCPPHAPTENPTGSYCRHFNVPSEWDASSQLRLRFDGVDSAFYLWLNGAEIGYSQGSRNPAEFDITNHVARGKPNHITVQVLQWCSGSYIEDQDQWWLSGIFRDVHVIALPGRTRIEDLFIKTQLDKEYHDADLTIDLDLKLDDDCLISLVLKDDEDNTIYRLKPTTVSSNSLQYSHSIHVSNPYKWTAETPFLYTLDITISSDHGNTSSIQHIRHRVGFRCVELKNGNICVNGEPILFRGTNRHDNHPHLGRAVPLDFVRNDLLLMKSHNINAVRCSHYPSHPGLTGLCDELGLWVIDEADLECHGFAAAAAINLNLKGLSDEEKVARTSKDAADFTSDNEAWKSAYLDRMHQLVERDKNHPSVIIWSLGNEAFFGRNHVAMSKWAKHRDPDRLIHYEQDGQAQSTDMVSHMYTSPEDLKKEAESEGDTFTKPIILCEYAHAMGNGPGLLETYQSLFRSHRRLQGGFIWEWANHGLWKEDPDGKKYYAYGGDFGDVPNDGTFVMDGLCNSDHSPSRGLVELKKTFEPIEAKLDGKDLIISNHYDFVDLGHVDAEYAVEAFGDETELIASGKLPLPRIKAGTSVKFHLPKAVLDIRHPRECWLKVSFCQKEDEPWAKAGHLIAWHQTRLKDLDANPSESSTSRSEARDATSGLKITASPLEFQISTATTNMTFDRVRGQISSWTYNATQLLSRSQGSSSALFALDFWRAPTDNDAAWQTGEWKRFGLHMMTSRLVSFAMADPHAGKADNTDTDTNTTTSSTGEKKADQVTFKARHAIAPPSLAWHLDVETTYTLSSSITTSVRPSSSSSSEGIRIKIHTHLLPRGNHPPTLPRVGHNIQLSPLYTDVAWFGRGPEESYNDKRASQAVGVWKRAVANMHTHYDVPQENGNRCDVRWCRVSPCSTSSFDDDDDDRDDRAATFALPCLLATYSPGPHARDRPTFQFATQMYDAGVTESASHPCDLLEQGKRREGALWRLDADVAGVGTAACGPGTEEKEQVECREREWTVELVPVLDGRLT